jgi:hypothetical protein
MVNGVLVYERIHELYSLLPLLLRALYYNSVKHIQCMLSLTYHLSSFHSGLFSIPQLAGCESSSYRLDRFEGALRLFDCPQRY